MTEVLTPYAEEYSIREFFREAFDDFSSSIDGRFFSLSPHSPALAIRLELRKYLVESLDQFVDIGDERKILLQPGQAPFSTKAAISLSHCKTLGGFIFCLNPDMSLGFDVEQMGRIKLPVIERISHSAEVKETPNKAFLWVAKEAAFKCLFSKDASVSLGQTIIHRWEKKSHYDLFQFEFKQYQGHGMVLVKEDLVFGGAKLT